MRNKNTVKLAILAVLVVPFGLWTLAQAQDSNDGSDENIQNRQEFGTQNRGNQAGNSAENRRSGQLVAIKRVVSNQVDRATKLVTRLSGVLDRIESRRDKMSEDGIDVTQVDQLIESTQTQETDTLEALEELKTAWANVELGTTEDPRSTVKSFMSAMNAFKREVIGFHKNLRETVQAMKRAHAAAVADDAEDDSDTDADSQDSDDSN